MKIFGDGIDLGRLQEMASRADNIEFLGRVSEEQKAELYKNSKAFINPQEEDFGITVVEAMACGRPVIAYKKGGATETVIEGQTGLFFNEQSVASLIECLRRFKEDSFSREAIRLHAEQFSTEKFKKQMAETIQREYERFKNGHEYLN